MYVYKLFTCLVVILAFASTEDVRVRTKRASCEYGEYTHEEKTCCRCPKGYRVSQDCTDTDERKCERCVNGTFMDHLNSDYNCQLCKFCDPNANMMVKETCSLYSNTVCGCQKDYYCDQGDLCRVCKPCDKCENEEKIKCTETNNTVCKDPTETTTSKGVIAAAILVPVLFILVIGVFCIWKRKQRLRLSRNKKPEETPLKQLDLNPYLPQIADHLSWKVMKRVAQHNGMNKAIIDNHEVSQPNDATERTYELLQDWSQTQGLYEAYPALIKSLHAIKQRKTADEIEKLVEEGQAKAHP